MAPNQDEVSSKLSSMSLSKDKPGKKPKAKNDVIDSWEDEDVSESEEPTTPTGATTTTTSAAFSPAPVAPPPTPATPSFAPPDDDWSSQAGFGSSQPPARDGRRPEKTDAVARRLIAAGLGLKAPKQTDEQRAYQKSVREQERKRKDQERAEQQQRVEASERAKASVWDD
ncbi:hypothetical protein V2A60_005683 [Cordyceps javanica]|uniref:Ubiquitin-like protein smt3 n=1 Tax=Cordyceps javanica TaxID=43265 RepID=A0A545VXT0_9HYPO|nr:hypothetical protein IF1G_06671 [Cordyceps javanica]TQW06531.1 hypothetical protein IF2G_05953 [Cordyceps javanica]